ncbi:MAG TPA: N,N-dimethylformamidase beta subunit family domain-containing protein, partial [Propionibacteriaceae bacterium]
GHNDGPGATKYWAQVGLADVAPGSYTCKSSRIIGSFQAACWAYTDTSDVPSHAPYPNPVVAENTLPGSKFSTWFGATTNANIAGFTNAISYTPGDTVQFKVDSGTAPFDVEVFRAGYYGYLLFGAKRKATVAGTPAVQPVATVDELGGTVCSWTTTSSWTIPTDATPGVYLANFRRTDATGGVAGTVFVVRSQTPANRTNQIMLKTSEFTWQAYNVWGGTGQAGTGNASYTGRSLYGQGGAAGLNIAQRAFGVSFNRPFSTGASNDTGYFFDAEYALLAFLEANGYDVAYYSSTDIDRDPTIPSKYRIAVTSAHDEYWTEGLHAAFEQARDTGTNLISFSSNTALWHVRYDPTDTSRRRMICYKDSHDTPGFDGVTRYDPVTYTGTWRDTRTTPGGVNNTDRRSESALFGQWFIGNGPQQRTIVVPDTFKILPIWRNTAVTTLAPGTTQALFTNSLGFEFDYVNTAPVADTPTNLVRLQTQSITLNGQAADDNGVTYTGDGAFLYGMSLYRADSGALVFGAGTWRWAAGLNRIRFGGADTTGAIDPVMQQATLNLLADLGVTPAALTTTTANGTTTALVDPSPAAGPADYGLTIDTGYWGIPIG